MLAEAIVAFGSGKRARRRDLGPRVLPTTPCLIVRLLDVGWLPENKRGSANGAGPTSAAVLQVELDAHSYSQGMTSHPYDSHVSGSQEGSETEGVL